MKTITEASIDLGRRFHQALALALFLLTAASMVPAAETVIYYHLDALGSPVAATDANGAVVWKEDYQPYGNRVEYQDGNTNSLWYTGKERDTAVGLDYFGARWYNPTLGRFNAIDPVDFDEANIHSFNRYAYANNNPYRYVDPDGNAPALAIWGFTALLTAYDMSANAPVPGHESDGVASVATMPGPVGLGAKSAGAVAGKMSDVTKKGLGENPFQGKTAQQIDKIFRDKGFDVKGTEPVAGKGSYINPKTGRKYYIDKGGEYKKGTELPHVDVHRPSGSSLPKKKLPLGDRLIE